MRFFLNIDSRTVEVTEEEYRKVYPQHKIRSFIVKQKVKTTKTFIDKLQGLPDDIFNAIKGFVGGRYTGNQWKLEHCEKMAEFCINIAKVADTSDDKYVEKHLPMMERVSSRFGKRSVKYEMTKESIKVVEPTGAGHIGRDAKARTRYYTKAKFMKRLALEAYSYYEGSLEVEQEKWWESQGQIADKPYPIYNEDGTLVVRGGKQIYGPTFGQMKIDFFKAHTSGKTHPHNCPTCMKKSTWTTDEEHIGYVLQILAHPHLGPQKK